MLQQGDRRRLSQDKSANHLWMLGCQKKCGISTIRVSNDHYLPEVKRADERSKVFGINCG
jgi:hypothetical protein